MYSKSKIIIGKDGKSTIIGEEKSDQCYKLSELGKQAGKVISDKDKDHTPVYQDVNLKN